VIALDIIRKQYLKEVDSVLGVPVIKVITGMRRVGKSTLLKQIQEMLIEKGVSPQHIISINFEWLEFEEQKDYKKLNRYIEEKIRNEGKHYVFLDEIQEVDGFEKVVNSLHSKGTCEIFITGSNSTLLSGELATYLTGRYYMIEVMPLSFHEIFQESISKEDAFMDYVRMGGLPGRLQFQTETTEKNYISDMYQAILLRDIVKRNNIRDVELFQRFMLFLIQNVGQIFSAGRVTDFLKNEGRKLSRETIYNYIEAAKNAYLIHGVPRYNIKGKDVLKTNEKYFVNDLGFRSLYYNNEKDIGQALENIVYLELRRRGYEIQVGKFEEKEVDFVIQKGSSKSYIQVAYYLAEEATIEREFSVLRNIEDNYPKLVLSMDRVNRSMDGIEHRNIIDFLLDI
jgi:predicted AAA+ superfamily ATPase